MAPWWPLTDSQWRPKMEASCPLEDTRAIPSLHPQTLCLEALTRPASSPLVTGAASRGRCHSPGPRLPAAAPAWPASPVGVRRRGAGAAPARGASGRSCWEHPAEPAAPPP